MTKFSEGNQGLFNLCELLSYNTSKSEFKEEVQVNSFHVPLFPRPRGGL